MEDITVILKEKNIESYNKLIKNRILFLTGEVNSELASEIVSNLLLLDEESKTEDIKLYISSEGGEVFSLFAIYDCMQYITAPVSTISVGESSSSAAVILAAGTKGKRFAFPNSTIMVHSVFGGAEGNTKEVELEAKQMKKINLQMIELLARHTGQSLRKIKKDVSKDKFFTAEEAVKYGLVDAIMPFVKQQPDLKK